MDISVRRHVYRGLKEIERTQTYTCRVHRYKPEDQIVECGGRTLDEAYTAVAAQLSEKSIVVDPSPEITPV